MQQSRLHTLFGTSEPPVVSRVVQVGDFRIQVSPGRLHHIFCRDVEILRAIELVVRDGQWSTLPLSTLEEEEQSTDEWRYRCHAETHSQSCGTLLCELHARVTADSIDVSLQLNGLPEFTTARAGLAVLYPLDGTVGRPVCVRHSDGSAEKACFPQFISPGQPFFDIAAIRHEPAPGLTATCRFDGDVFEMEDQRNWTDASYKVYNRPLAWPSPYVIDNETGAHQQIRLDVASETAIAVKTGADYDNHGRTREVSRVRIGGCGEARLPKLGTGLDIRQACFDEAAASLLSDLAPGHVQLLIDLRDAEHERALEATLAAMRVAGIEAPLWAGVITPDTLDQLQPLSALAQVLARMETPLDGVLALPAAYLKSHQPDAQWPTGASPADAITAARSAFPNTPVGGGMLTYFTELNRCRPVSDDIDFISHATTAVVHAADDTSVMETLDGIGYVFKSCQALAPNKQYRLGMSAIGMWANPYGLRPLSDPLRRRVPMTGQDPRQQGLFAAAWNLGYYAVASRTGVDSLALSSVTGPFAVGRGDMRHPVFHVLRGLCRASGAVMLDCRMAGKAPLAVIGWHDATYERCEVWLANLALEDIFVELEGMRVEGVRLLDADNMGATSAEWMDQLQTTAETKWKLGPYAVLRLIGQPVTKSA